MKNRLICKRIVLSRRAGTRRDIASQLIKSVAGLGTQPQVSRCLFASFSALEKEDIHLKPLTPGEVARSIVTERAFINALRANAGRHFRAVGSSYYP